MLRAAAGDQGNDSPIGRCLGTQGVNIVLARLQQALIADGWVTTRVLAAPQDLARGTLALTLVPGRIAAIRLADGQNGFANKVAHALAGCAVGAARTDGGCGAGAIGAVIGELSAETFGFDEHGNPKAGTAELAAMLGAMGAAIAGLDASQINLAANAASNAAVNNALKHYVDRALSKLNDSLKAQEIKPLVESQKIIRDYLESAGARGGLTETEIVALGILYAANEALFPTGVLDVLPGGKAVSKVGAGVKAGGKAEDVAKAAAAEARAGAHGGIDLNAQATLSVNKITAPIDFDGHILGAEIKANGTVVGSHLTATGTIQVVPGTANAPNAQGVYSAQIEVADPNNPGQFLPKTNNGGLSTMFPDSWTKDRIKVEVDAAFHNRTVVGNKWTGTTPSGVRVEGYINPKTTVYPKL